MARPRPQRRRLTGSLACALALTVTAVLPVTACTAAPASVGRPAAAVSAGGAAPAITTAGARQVFNKYVAAQRTASLRAISPLLDLVTGVEQSVLSAKLASHGVTGTGTGTAQSSAYTSSLTVTPTLDHYAYGKPSFYLPEASGYPRFFLASVRRTLTGTRSAGGATTLVGGTRVPDSGPVLMLFTQASAGASWLLAECARLPSGMTLPRLAAIREGRIPTVPPSQGTLLVRPVDIGALQAAVVDNGPASIATRAVASGPLTTGMYQGATDHASGITAPPGDVYQWELAGSSDPEFAVRTTDGGALVFYTMTLTTTVAVPDVINKANPVHSGRPITVPATVRMLLPEDAPRPRVELQAQQTLSFAAIDPAPGGKVRVIAIGGGLSYATAT